MEKHPEVGGDTAWVSGYGLYDELSPHMQKFLEGLHAIHTSRLQYDTTIVRAAIIPIRLPIRPKINKLSLAGLLQRQA